MTEAIKQEMPREAARRLTAATLKQGFRLEALHPYTGINGEPSHWSVRLKNPDTGEKQIFPMQTRDGNYALKMPAFPDGRPLYNLHCIVATPDATVIVVEGENCADALTKLGLPATTSGGAQSADKADWQPLQGRHIVIWRDNDEAGLAYQNAVIEHLQRLGCAITTVDVAALNLPDKGDCADWLAKHPDADKSAVLALPTMPVVQQAIIDQTATTDDATGDDEKIAELAALSPMAYDRRRKDEAKKLGVQLKTLDEAVKQKRQEQEESTVDEEYRAGVSAWEDEVDGGTLAEKINNTFTEHAVLPPHADTVLTLWTIGSYCFNAFRVFPFLVLTSPEKRCGKTTTLSILQGLVNKALMSGNVTPSALFRSIEAWQPTLLIDEADTFMRDNEELRGILNSGHSKDAAYVLRTEGDGNNREPKRFSTWSPRVIASIKLPPDTIVDRAVVIPLKRKLPSEQVTPLSLSFKDDMLDVRRQCRRWADDRRETLPTVHITPPDMNNDRAAQNWQPLLTIAALLGGDWLHKAEQAARYFAAAQEDDEAAGVKLLHDIRKVLTAQTEDKLHTATLLGELKSIEESLWSEWGRGKGLNARSLAKLLRPYGIQSKQMKINGINKHGYATADFQDAFNRYLTTEKNARATVSDNLPLPRYPDNKINGLQQTGATLPDATERYPVTFRDEVADTNATVAAGVADN